jgi:hypothetical protein
MTTEQKIIRPSAAAAGDANAERPNSARQTLAQRSVRCRKLGQYPHYRLYQGAPMLYPRTRAPRLPNATRLRHPRSP